MKCCKWAGVFFFHTVDAAFHVLNSHNSLGKGFKPPLKPLTKEYAETILQKD